MCEEEIRLYASHNQFYITDGVLKLGSPGGPFWTQDAFERRLAVGDGILGVGTSTYGFVNVRAQYLESAPPVDLANWDHVCEAGLVVTTGLVLIAGCLSVSGLFFQVKPQHYGVRACHANLAESEQEVPSDWEGDFGDWYMVQFWPSSPFAPQVLKQRTSPGG